MVPSDYAVRTYFRNGIDVSIGRSKIVDSLDRHRFRIIKTHVHHLNAKPFGELRQPYLGEVKRRFLFLQSLNGTSTITGIVLGW